MYLMKLNNFKSSKNYKILIENEDCLPNLTIIDKENSYRCKVSQEDVDKFAEMLEIDAAIYLQQLKDLLRDEATAVDVNNLQLQVFKNEKTKYFIRSIEEIDHVEALHKCLDFLYDRNSQNSKEKTDLITNKSDLRKELQNYKDKLEKCVVEAQERENRLYSCFIQLLNEKKKYIRHLRNFVDKKDLDKMEVEKGKLVLHDSDASSSDAQTSNASDTDIEEYPEQSDTIPTKTQFVSRGIAGNIEAGPSNMETTKSSKNAITKRLTLDDALLEDGSGPRMKKLCLRPYKSLPNETCASNNLANSSNSDNLNDSCTSSSQSTQIVNYSTQDLLDSI